MRRRVGREEGGGAAAVVGLLALLRREPLPSRRPAAAAAEVRRRGDPDARRGAPGGPREQPEMPRRRWSCGPRLGEVRRGARGRPPAAARHGGGAEVQRRDAWPIHLRRRRSATAFAELGCRSPCTRGRGVGGDPGGEATAWPRRATGSGSARHAALRDVYAAFHDVLLAEGACTASRCRTATQKARHLEEARKRYARRDRHGLRRPRGGGRLAERPSRRSCARRT